MTAVADGPSGAAGNTESLGLFVERLESNKLGGFGELPDLRRLPCFDFRWAHKLHLSFVFYLSLEASIAFTRDCRACAEKPGREARALAHGLQSRVANESQSHVHLPSLSLPLADAGDRIPKAPRGHGS